MKNSRLILVLSNTLTSITGGLLLTAAIDLLANDQFLWEYGKLSALLLGSAIGFLINQWAATWGSFRHQANLPFIAIPTDGLILIILAMGSQHRLIAWIVFLLLCFRWASWSSARSVRAGAAPNLDLGVHFTEAAGFLGLVIGASLPVAIFRLTGDTWRPRLESLLIIDSCLFLTCGALDHWIARRVDFNANAGSCLLWWKNASEATRNQLYTLWTRSRVPALDYVNTVAEDDDLKIFHSDEKLVSAVAQAKIVTRSQIEDSAIAPTSSRYTLFRIMAIIICLTISTQMLIFTFHGSLGIFKVENSKILHSLIVPSVYLGAAIGALLGGIVKAKLLFSEYRGQHLRFCRFGVNVPLWCLYLVAVGSTLAALWISPKYLVGTATTLIALLVNTLIFTSALSFMFEKYGRGLLVKALGAYFPLVIGGYVALSLLITYVIGNHFAAKMLLSVTGIVGLIAVLKCTYLAISDNGTCYTVLERIQQ